MLGKIRTVYMYFCDDNYEVGKINSLKNNFILSNKFSYADQI